MSIHVINAWTSKDRVKMSYRDSSGRIHFKDAPAHYTAFVKDKPDPIYVLGDQRVVGHKIEGEWIRLFFRDYDSRKAWCYEHPEIQTWESDVTPVKRLMADSNIEVQKPRRAFWDLETDSRVPFIRKEEARILSWTVMGSDGRARQGLLAADTDVAEKYLLEEMEEAFADYDQVAAWNGFSFDEVVRAARLKHHGIWGDRRLMFVDQMLAFRRMNLQVASGGDEKQSTALNAIGQALLGEGKHDFNSAKTWEAWASGAEGRDMLMRYNLQDVDLQRKIEAKTGYLDAFQIVCEVCHIFPHSHSLKPTAQHDGYMLRKARQLKTHLPSKVEREARTQFAGAYVMPPTKSGILRDVHVGDYAGLYPSILETFNLDHTTKITDESIPHCAPPLTPAIFRTDVKGMIPIACAEFKTLREKYKKAKKAAVPNSDEWKTADRYQNVFKVLVNSLYGIIGSPYSRFFDEDIALAVTQTGVWLIKQAIAECTKKGYSAIYADTDGIYFQGCTSEQAGEFVRWFSDEFMPIELKKLGCVSNSIRLDYQESFSRLVFPLGAADLLPSAKRYCGRFSVYDGKPITEYAVEIKGLEVRRGDTSRLSRQMQQEVVDLLMHGEEDPLIYVALVDRWQKRITMGKLDIDDIGISKSVKDLDSYSVRVKKNGSPMPQAAHVEIAKILQERGEDVSQGTRIKYIVLDASVSPQVVIPVCDFKGEFDRHHMWNDVTFPASMRLLAGAFNTVNWNRWILKRPKKVLAGQLSFGV